MRCKSKHEDAPSLTRSPRIGWRWDNGSRKYNNVRHNVIKVSKSLTQYTNGRDRAKWTSWVGATWAVAAASGPLVGGAMASSTTWRWCFLINLPVGAICSVIIFVYLHLDSPTLSFWDKAPRVDYLGTILIGGCALMLLLALNWAGAGFGWGSAMVIGLLVGSGAALIPFWLYVSMSLTALM